MPKKVIVDEQKLVQDYLNGMSIYDVCDAHHVGKIKAKDILARNGVTMRKRGGQETIGKLKVPDFKIRKYQEREGYHIIVYDTRTDFKTTDILNASGILTTYIEKRYGVPTPTLYDRRMYYMKNGDYWWEQWLSVRYELDKVTKKCPYCDWETIDVTNKSGYFAQHVQSEHGISPDVHLKKYPEDVDFFRSFKNSKEREVILSDPTNFTICPICGKKFKKLTISHIESVHEMKWEEFKKEYPDAVVLSEDQARKAIESIKLGNLIVSKDRFVSKYERELQSFLNENGIKFEPNRQILIGREIDLYIPEMNIGIEFDGLKFHTEFFGRKPHTYHVEKTNKCNSVGVGLIHIFEDEYVNHREIVFDKLRHILKLDYNKDRIMGRKCEIRVILKHTAEEFLNKYHIQGFGRATTHIGAFYHNKLIAVMSFKNNGPKSKGWELTRYASDTHYRLQGVASKIFKNFVKTNDVETVISFADRRWTLSSDKNLYTNLNFTLDKVCPPDYRYYNERVERFKRFHKMAFNKKKLIKEYGFPETMTELEMARELGYDRIWDCGLFRYVWKAQK